MEYLGPLCLLTLLIWYWGGKISKLRYSKIIGWGVKLLSFPAVIFLLEMPFVIGGWELSDKNILEQVKLELDKGQLKLKKKIPYYIFSPNSFRGIDYQNYEECSELCDQLVKGEYVNVFYGSYDWDSIAITTNFKIVEVAEDLSVTQKKISISTYNDQYDECYFIEKDNFLSPVFSYNNRYHFCHQGGVLITAFATLNGKNSYYSRMLSGGNDIIINKLNWYQIYKLMNGETNE